MCLLVTGSVASGPATAKTGAKPRGGVLKVPLPSPGNISIAHAKIRAARGGKSAAALPRLKLADPARFKRSAPKTVTLAAGVIREKGSLHAVFVALNKRSGAARAAASHVDVPVTLPPGYSFRSPGKVDDLLGKAKPGQPLINFQLPANAPDGNFKVLGGPSIPRFGPGKIAKTCFPIAGGLFPPGAEEIIGVIGGRVPPGFPPPSSPPPVTTPAPDPQPTPTPTPQPQPGGGSGPGITATGRWEQIFHGETDYRFTPQGAAANWFQIITPSNTQGPFTDPIGATCTSPNANTRQCTGSFAQDAEVHGTVHLNPFPTPGTIVRLRISRDGGATAFETDLPKSP